MIDDTTRVTRDDDLCCARHVAAISQYNHIQQTEFKPMKIKTNGT